MTSSYQDHILIEETDPHAAEGARVAVTTAAGVILYYSVLDPQLLFSSTSAIHKTNYYYPIP